MLKHITTKTLNAVALAALLAGLVVALTSVTPQARAEPQIETTGAQPVVKTDRLPPRVTGAPCSSGAWPNYDRTCQFDLRPGADESRAVRIITLR